MIVGVPAVPLYTSNQAQKPTRAPAQAGCLPHVDVPEPICVFTNDKLERAKYVFAANGGDASDQVGPSRL